MTTRLILVVACLSGAVITASTQAQNAPRQYVTAAPAVTFTPLDPSAPAGPAVSVVSGSLQGKGPITLFLKLGKGPAPLHTHTSGYYGVVVRGQAKHWPANGQAAAQTLTAGSHWYQPAKAPHGDECLSDECLLLIQMEGPYDFAPATP